jgi:RecA-family ATPase
LSFIDMSRWDSEPAPDREWAVFNRIPLYQTTLFSGEGGAGKGIIQLHLCIAQALGRDWLGSVVEQGPAIFVETEDDAKELRRRTGDIANHYGVPFTELIEKGLHLMSFAGMDAVLATVTRGGKIEPTRVFAALAEAAGDIKPKMIGIASSANVFAGSEIDPQVQQFVSLLTGLAMRAQGAVSLISHPSLAGISSGTGLSGSTAWHNSVRARMYLTSPKQEPGEQPDSDLRQLEFHKNQYGARGDAIVLRWQNGLFLPVPGTSCLDRAAQEARAEDAFLDVLRRFTRENRNAGDRKGPSYAPALFAKEDEAKRAALTSKALDGAMLRLFKAGKIWNEPYGKPSRQFYRLAIK